MFYKIEYGTEYWGTAGEEHIIAESMSKAEEVAKALCDENASLYKYKVKNKINKKNYNSQKEYDSDYENLIQDFYDNCGYKVTEISEEEYNEVMDIETRPIFDFEREEKTNVVFSYKVAANSKEEAEAALESNPEKYLEGTTIITHECGDFVSKI